MDKFDDYLEKQKTNEKENFVLPKSFDDKIEETLMNLDDIDKKEVNKWYVNKKLWVTAACFAFICLAGLGLKERIGLNNSKDAEFSASNEDFKMKSSSSDSGETEGVAYDSNIESYGLQESSKADGMKNEYGLNADNIYSVTIEAIQASSKYKEVTNKEDINKIIDLINVIPLYENINQDIKEYQYVIKIYGTTDHIYTFADDLVSIDGTWYKTSDEELNILKELYDNLKYEEKLVN